MKFIRLTSLLLVLSLFLSQSLAARYRPTMIVQVDAARANVRPGDRLGESDRVLVDAGGFVDLLLDPWRSLRIEAYGCTELRITRLRVIGHDLSAAIEWKDRVLCRDAAYARMISTFVNPGSRLVVVAGGRKLQPKGTTWALSEGADGALLIGAANGEVDATYQGSEVTIEPGEYTRSVDHNPLEQPRPAPPLEPRFVRHLPGGLYLICTHPDNQIAIGQLSEDGLCWSAKLGDQFIIKSPTGAQRIWRVDKSMSNNHES